MTFRERLATYLLGGLTKESQARMVTTFNQIGKPIQTPANYEGFAVQGYNKNLIVYSAISKITTAAKGINWCLYQKPKSSQAKLQEIEAHPLLDLIRKPNPLQAGAAFFESVIGYKLIAGNSYIEANVGSSQNMSGAVLELWPVRPDKMKIVGGLQGYPAAYIIQQSGREFVFPIDPITIQSKIFHWKGFHPTNDWYGLSPLEAAMLTLDQNNAGQRWNLALLQNSAQPSGVLQMKVSDVNPRGMLTDEQYIRVKKEIEDNYSGPRNAGRPLIIEGGLNWQAVSLSPKEMDFLKSREVTAVDLCVLLGVPPEVMGLGQKTFNNYEEARCALYEDTVMPHMDDLRDGLNNWLTPAFGEGLYLDYDRDDIEALGPKRNEKFQGLKDVGFLTVNEKRHSCGYDEIDGGDELDKPSAPSVGGNDNQDPNNPDNQDPKNPNKKPPKKDPKNPDNQDPQNEDDQAANDNGKGFNWKSINLLNRREKIQSWKKQNQRRKQLAHGLSAELRADFKDLNGALQTTAQELKGREPKVIEYALNRVATEWSRKELKRTLSRHIKLTLHDFGGMVLGEAKSLGLVLESKANLKFEMYVNEYVATHTATQISTINSTNEKTVRRIITEWVKQNIENGDTNRDLSDMIKEKFDELSDSSADRIARTEVGMASSQGALNAVKSLGAPEMYKEWVSAEDDRVRAGEHGGADHESADGQEVALDDKFTVPPDASMDGPGDPSAGADQVINCRCVLTFRSKAKNE